jgi:hypothetical protein
MSEQELRLQEAWGKSRKLQLLHIDPAYPPVQNNAHQLDLDNLPAKNTYAPLAADTITLVFQSDRYVILDVVPRYIQPTHVHLVYDVAKKGTYTRYPRYAVVGAASVHVMEVGNGCVILFEDGSDHCLKVQWTEPAATPSEIHAVRAALHGYVGTLRDKLAFGRDGDNDTVRFGGQARPDLVGKRLQSSKPATRPDIQPNGTVKVGDHTLLPALNISRAGSINSTPSRSKQVRNMTHDEIVTAVSTSAQNSIINLLLESGFKFANEFLTSAADNGVSWDNFLRSIGQETRGLQATFVATLVMVLARYYDSKLDICDRAVRTDRIMRALSSDSLLHRTLQNAGIQSNTLPSSLAKIPLEMRNVSFSNTSEILRRNADALWAISVPMAAPLAELDKTVMDGAIKHFMANRVYNNSGNIKDKFEQQKTILRGVPASDADLHYFGSAVFAEINRLTVVKATREADAVPMIKKEQAGSVEENTLSVFNEPLNAVSTSGHIHPVAMFFNVGVMRAICDAARQGITVRAVRASSLPESLDGKAVLHWPKFPAVTFLTKHETHVVPPVYSALLATDIATHFRLNAASSSRPSNAPIFLMQLCDRLLDRAQFVHMLPSVAVLDIFTDKRRVVMRQTDVGAPVHLVLMSIRTEDLFVALYAHVGGNCYQVYETRSDAPDVCADPEVVSTLRVNFPEMRFASLLTGKINDDLYVKAFELDRLACGARRLSNPQKSPTLATIYTHCDTQNTLYGMPSKTDS